jgi:hypothetical protein
VSDGVPAAPGAADPAEVGVDPAEAGADPAEAGAVTVFPRFRRQRDRMTGPKVVPSGRRYVSETGAPQ